METTKISSCGEWVAIENESKEIVDKDCAIGKIQRDLLEENSSFSWESFYQKHKNKFFNERYYLDREFEELGVDNGKITTVLEIGCGSGSTTLPLMVSNKSLSFFSIDCSNTAIELLKAHKDYDANRCIAVTCDVVVDSLPDIILDSSIDICIMTFFLSALSPEKMESVVDKVYKKLQYGGIVLFRDYGIYDMAMLRFAKDQNHKLCDNLYVRNDGTLAYYFSVEFLQGLFAKCFEIVELKYVISKVKNAATRKTMNRVWIQGKFRKV